VSSTDTAQRSLSASIDASLLFWTRLPPEAGRLDDRQQDYRFERVLPLPVEGLHIVRSRLEDGSTLLVGIEPERLRQHLAERQDVSGDTWELLPDRLPGHLTGVDATAALSGLNLLQGPFEPVRRRQARRGRDLAIAIGLGLTLVLALIGIERRVAAQTLAVASLRSAGQELITRTLGTSSGRTPGAIQLTQELRRLELAARGSLTAPVDAAGLLQRLWTGWPAEVPCRVETVALTPDRLVVRGTVPTLVDAERIAKANPTLASGDAVFLAAPLQAEQTVNGAVFLITWTLQTTGPNGGPR
jgi:hypothetical protein